ncbi:hypothetical protein ACEPAI_9612 [Sanghuangporus weigelae]
MGSQAVREHVALDFDREAHPDCSIAVQSLELPWGALCSPRTSERPSHCLRVSAEDGQDVSQQRERTEDPDEAALNCAGLQSQPEDHALRLLSLDNLADCLYVYSQKEGSVSELRG